MTTASNTSFPTQGGRHSQRIGADFEKFLEESHRGYMQCGIACIDKIPHCTVPTGKRDPVTNAPFFRLAGRPPYDYHGYFLPDSGIGGIAIAMEAKSTTREMSRLPIIARGKKGFGIEQHQLDALADAEQAGCMAAIVYQVQDKILVCPHPLRLLKMIKLDRRKSIPLAPTWWLEAPVGQFGNTPHCGVDWISCCDDPPERQ